MQEIIPDTPTTFDSSLDSSNPLISKALKFIREKGLSCLPREKIYIGGSDIIFNGIVNAPLKAQKDAFLEAHKDYIDLQVIVSGTESFGLKNVHECKDVRTAYNSEKDVVFFNDAYSKIVTLTSGQVILFPPESAHAPQIGEGSVLKGVFKIKAPKQ